MTDDITINKNSKERKSGKRTVDCFPVFNIQMSLEIKEKPALKQQLLVRQIWLLFQEPNAEHAQSANHYKQYLKLLVLQNNDSKATSRKESED